MIAIGSDHGGYKLKEEIKKYLEENAIKYIDVGTYSEERVDYIDIAADVAKKIQKKEAKTGILICRTGFGMAIVANKFKGVMCAPCYDEYTASKAREHNNANILALGGDIINTSKAIAIVRTWIATEFLGGRYEERLKMIQEIESKNFK